ncbi:putative ebna2 binding protein P100 [Monocercomonoides exilis]|uniref:putative ebna2 binding protein P100 n=1 Tax=Monocercomonoides exilis TaxID=2049356 RepID=UPI0035597A4F|nr:putative ebna2 binding protein P100 [Monocercomonoides exilis]|eukprot:MONOS_7849.1-p1 / transcript=MONOS_7849.1 / gene=MONOS_7849 / organism=Monocercomonoides_exilis_PA203 / gene_product=tudor staphylococcus / transcript_product=tudor staphylococcus / location=Mono_scaffold00280:8915-12961(-) / protein_length=1276 / sequence_SO=supercontig / SO=protein_coding / is_pseudo=false
MSVGESNLSSLPKAEIKPKARAAPVILDGSGIIKYVNSATSVTVMGQPREGPPPEIVVFFEGIDSPRFRNGQDIDPKAYYLREILRKFCIGKTCHFHTTQDLPASGSDSPTQKRRFGTITLDDGKVNLTEWVLSNGLAVVRQSRVPFEKLPKPVQEQQKALLELEEKAKAAGLGLHAQSLPIVTESHTPINIANFLKDNKGKEVPAVVDHITTGSSMRAYVQYGGSLYSLPFQITHVLCPGFTRSEESVSSVDWIPQPFAEQAKYFVEKEILQRDIVLVPDSNDRDKLSARVIAPKGDLGTILLRFGFARLVGLPANPPNPDAASGSLPLAVEKAYRAEQAAAQGRKDRVWHDYVPPPPRPEKEVIQSPEPTVLEQYFGLVTEVTNGDTIMVAPIALEAEGTREILGHLHLIPAGSEQKKEREIDIILKAKEQQNEDSKSGKKGKKGKQGKKDQKPDFVPPVDVFEPVEKPKRPPPPVKLSKVPSATFNDGAQLAALAHVLMPERKVSLASVVAPKLNLRNGPGGAGNNAASFSTASDVAKLNPPQPPYAWEAREHLRKLLVGKIVAVNVEYRRNILASGQGAGTIERDYAAVNLAGENMSVHMVKEGLAKPARHRPEEPRSAFYGEILKAEEASIKGKKKLFQFDHELTQFTPGLPPPPLKPGERRKPYALMTEEERAEVEIERKGRIQEERNKRDAERREILRKVAEKAPVIRYNDISYDAKMNRQFVSTFLTRSTTTSKFRGFVEAVMNPSRVLIVVPRQSLIISFVLEGLRAPQRAPRRPIGGGEEGAAAVLPSHPYADEAAREARLMLLNRDVEFIVSRLENSGRSWIGTLMLDGMDVSERLLDAGLCWISARDESAVDAKLTKAQQHAQAAKRGIWQFPNPTMETERRGRRQRFGAGGEDEEDEEDEEDGEGEDGEDGPSSSSVPSGGYNDRRGRKGRQDGSGESQPAAKKEGVKTKCHVVEVIDSGIVVVQTEIPPDVQLNKRCAEILSLPAENETRKKMCCFSETCLPSVQSDVAVRVNVNGNANGAGKGKKGGKTKKEWRRGHVEKIITAEEDEELTEPVICFTLIDTRMPVIMPLKDVEADVMCMDPAMLEIPACAFLAFLAFVRPIPDQPDVMEEAEELLRQLTVGKELECSNEWVDRENRPYVVLTMPTGKEASASASASASSSSPSSSSSSEKSSEEPAASAEKPQNVLNLNLEILRRGLVVTDEQSVPSFKRRELREYEDAEEEARTKHLGGWKHGDFRTEEEFAASERRKRREKQTKKTTQ